MAGSVSHFRYSSSLCLKRPKTVTLILQPSPVKHLLHALHADNRPWWDREARDDVEWSEPGWLHVHFQEHVSVRCVFNFFGGKFWVAPSNPVHPPHLPTPPRRTLRCWHVDKSSCLSQPCVLIRSSTSKDWIIACCPRACRSLPCCRTAGDRQSALSLRALGGEKKLRAVRAVSGRQVDDVFTLTSAQLGNTYAALCS